MRRLSRALAALSLCLTGTLAYADTDTPVNNPIGWIMPTGGTSSSSLQNLFNERRLTLYDFGVTPSSTVAAQTAALNTAIAACNAGTLSALVIPTGLWQLNAEPNALLPTGSSSCVFFGDGIGATLLRFPASAATSLHTFWKLGNDATRAVNVTISDMTLQLSNSPTADAGCALNVESANDFRFQNIRILGSTCPLQLDTAAEAGGTPTRGVFQNITGDINNGLNETCNVLIYGGSSISFNWWNFTGAGASNVNAAGSLECLTPASGHQIDTLRHSGFGMQSFTSVVAADGKPYGAKIDSTSGNVYNVSYDSLSYFDHTTTGGVLYTASVGGTGLIRNHIWTGTRHTPDTGSALIIDVNSGQLVRSVRFLGSRFFVRAAAIPIQVKLAHDGGATDYQNDTLEGVDVEDIGTSVVKEAAFEFEADGWSVPTYAIGSATRATSGFSEVLKVTNASLVDLSFGCGAIAPDITTFSAEPTYSPLYSLTRRICHPVLFTSLAGGMTLGNPTGGDKGAGTFNATTLYEAGTAIASKYAPIASPTFTGTVTLPDGSMAASSTFTFGNLIAVSNHNMTGAANIVANNANGYELIGGAVTATAPALSPNKSDLKAGIGADAAGDVSIITDNATVATELARFTGTGMTLNAALTYGGVTLSNAVTGTGNMVLSASPIFTGTPKSPNFAGGSSVSQAMVIETTTGVGSSDSMAFKTGAQSTFLSADTNGLISLPKIASDTAHTDASVCEDTTTHALYSGSGTLGICLGTSSARYKRDINPLDEGLVQVLSLDTKRFFYKPGHGDNGAREQFGFLAEDVFKVMPKLVGLDKTGKPNSVDLLGMVPVMVRAIQQQQDEIRWMWLALFSLGFGFALVLFRCRRSANDNELVRKAA